MDPGSATPPAPDQDGEPVSAREMGWAAGTWSGRIVVSTILAFLAFTLVVWNLPDSEIRSDVRPSLRPVVNAMAIDQSWSVFAPNPTTLSLAVEADVYLEGGELVRYRFPHGDDFVGAYREYRWRKWERRVRLDSNDHLWQSTAEWVAEQFPESSVVRVVLIRNFSDTPRPGSSQERVWDSFEFFTLDFGQDES
ncbi:MAG: hypothetical protein ACR2PK_07470 [Acidimicrobiales bacterium]